MKSFRLIISQTLVEFILLNSYNLIFQLFLRHVQTSVQRERFGRAIIRHHFLIGPLQGDMVSVQL